MPDTAGGAIVYEVNPEALLAASRECQDVADAFGGIVALCESRPVPAEGAPPRVRFLITTIASMAQRFVTKGREGQQKFSDMSQRLEEVARQYQEADETAAQAFTKVPENGEDVFSGDEGATGGGGTGAGGSATGDSTGNGAGLGSDGPGPGDGDGDGDGDGAQDQSVLTEENQQLRQQVEQLQEQNQQLVDQTEQLAEQNQQLFEESMLIANRDAAVSSLPQLRTAVEHIDDENNDTIQKKITRDRDIERAYIALLEQEGKPVPDLDGRPLYGRYRAFENRIEAYYDRLDNYDGVSPQTTDPGEVAKLQALQQEGMDIATEYEEIKAEVQRARNALDDGLVERRDDDDD